MLFTIWMLESASRDRLEVGLLCLKNFKHLLLGYGYRRRRSDDELDAEFDALMNGKRHNLLTDLTSRTKFDYSFRGRRRILSKGRKGQDFPATAQQVCKVVQSINWCSFELWRTSRLQQTRCVEKQIRSLVERHRDHAKRLQKPGHWELWLLKSDDNSVWTESTWK